MEKRNVYLDYSATTPLKDEVLEAMMPYLKEKYGNPSSIYSKGIENKEAIKTSRLQISKLINSEKDEIYFTGSGSESDNWAIFGTASSLRCKHIITSNIEHHAVLNSLEHLESQGYEVTYLKVNEQGLINPDDLEKAIKDDTILVTIMMANNEIGTIQPIKKLARIAHDKGVLFHCDAVQALGNIPIDVNKLGVDMMSFSAHKLYGPKGIGALFIKDGVEIDNLIYGGAQENGKRAGTENVPSIVGFGKASALALSGLTEHIAHCLELRNYFADRLFEDVFDTHVNGTMLDRLPGNLNISFDFIEGEAILMMLDYMGISVSTGSACSSSSGSPSHVLSAIGVPESRTYGTIRFSIGDFTTKEDIDYVIDAIKDITKKLKELSPFK
ncbi:MAG: cysteine desulfurase NifS [Peptostreptococcaceae bacterium]|nr:cysteine desulfurase NifS [Peptostreptococcaceae bacterium]